MKKELETRYFSASEVRLAGTNEKPIITGFAAVYNSLSHDLGGFREKIEPGCFTRSLNDPDSDVIANIDHDNRDILARQRTGSLRLFDEPRGLRFEIDTPNTTAGRDAVENVRNGNLPGCSFAFRVAENGEYFDETDNETIRTLRDASLFDICVCSSPAYPDTEVGLRSLEKWRETRKTTEEEDDEENCDKTRIESAAIDQSPDPDAAEEEDEPTEETKELDIMVLVTIQKMHQQQMEMQS